MGWESEDDTLTTLVKTGDGKSTENNGDDGRRIRENSAGPEDVDGVTRWMTVEELKGDEIGSRSRSNGMQNDRKVMTFMSEKIAQDTSFKKRFSRRHRREEAIPSTKDVKFVGDCVLGGKSIRIKDEGTTEEKREKKIMEDEETDTEEEDDGRMGERGDNSDNAKKGQGHRGNHVIVMVEEGSEARMACHPCSKTGRGGRAIRLQEVKKDERKSALWYRLTRVKEKRHYKIKEVSLDMHDDTSRDKVYVTRDHTLVIARSTSRKGGSYFCKSPDESGDVTIQTSVPEEEMEHLFKNPHVRYFYHLDVLTDAQEEAILVTSHDEASGVDSLPTPRPPVDMMGINVKVFTDWQEWSPCSVCDRQGGTRRRVGQCLVTKLQDNETSSPVFLEAVLSSYEGGVPCRSSLLHGHKNLRHLISKPEEIMQEDCDVTCAVHHAHLVMSASGFLGSQGNKHHQLNQKKFRESEGDHVVLKCLQTPIDKAVAWINGSNILVPTHLNEKTRGRVWVDEHNSLHIHPVLPWDAASYVCLVQGQVKGFVKLAVKAKPPDCIVCRYAMYLAMTFPVNFVIWCLIVYAKHQERKRVLNYDLLPVESSSSSSSSIVEGD